MHDETLRPARGPIFALLAANMVSEVGNAVTAIAIPWFVLATTGSAARAGIVGAATFLPVVLVGLLGGVLVDRVGFKRMSVIADIASGLSVTLIPLLYHAFGLRFWQLVVLVFLGALLDSPGTTARRSLVPDLAELGRLELERANAFAQSAETLARLVGPPLAGVLISIIGPSNALWVDAVSFFFSAAMVAALVPAHARDIADAATAVGAGVWRYLHGLREGFAFVRHERLVRAIVINSFFTNFAAAPLGAVVLPAFGRDTYGSATDLGLILAGSAIGALVGTLAFGAFGRRLPRHATYTACFLLFGAPYALLALQPPLTTSIAITTFAGLMFGPVNPIGATIAQERVPAAMRGRVFGMTGASSIAAAPLGMLAIGVLVQVGGPNVGLLFVGAMFMLMTLNLALNPAFRAMNQPPDMSTTSRATPLPT